MTVRKKIKIGLTGGIGSGKSVVARILSGLGVPVYDSDSEAKRLTLKDNSIREQLIALLGSEIFYNGSFNKQLLSSYLFSSAENAQRVNDIIHPCVKKDFKLWVEQQDRDILAIESAILIEAGFRMEVDYLVLVYAPVELRIERTMARDNLSRQAVESKLSRQLSDEEKKKQADFIIINDGVEPLIPQVYSLLEEINRKLI
ncbi:MAG: dephospho-CoA kinase [Bacteroidales bacterium]|nr:dephospho-CoA kinase [Bacteroidales bacterium]